MMIIREISQGDDAAIKAIIQESLESFGLDVPGTAYCDPHLGELSSYYAAIPQSRYWVVESEGEVVGGVGIAPYGDNDKVCELQKLYLDPDVQGQGLSRKLMDTALNFAASHYEQCYLETMQVLATAQVLYEKYGFRSLPEPLPGSEHSAADTWFLKELGR